MERCVFCQGELDLTTRLCRTCGREQLARTVGVPAGVANGNGPLPWHCPRCGTPTQSEDRFCMRCGVPLRALCLHCGQESLIWATFCLHCGHPLHPAAAQPPGMTSREGLAVPIVHAEGSLAQSSGVLSAPVHPQSGTPGIPGVPAVSQAAALSMPGGLSVLSARGVSQGPGGKTNRMNCFAHPETNAVAQCSRCRKGMCGVCAHSSYSTDGAILCFSCYESWLRAEIARARRSTVGVWIFTGAVTLCAAISSVANNAGGAIILVVPLAFALSWCLFWGWMPVWKEFRKILGGLGCIFGPALLLAMIAVMVAGILVAIAIPIGAATGIKKYSDARQLAANGNQMLAALHGMNVQRIS